MNFQDTLAKLYEITEKITVYAARGWNWNNGKCFENIWIRSYFSSYDNHDPVIDDLQFMVCGDVYDAENECLTSIDDLANADTDTANLHVSLRAVYSYPYTTIGLGAYRIVKKMLEITTELSPFILKGVINS